VLGVSACAPPVTLVDSQFAAKTQAADYRRGAVLPFEGANADEATKEFESMLTTAQFNGKPYFTVIDRTNLQKAMNELKLHNSGLVDPKNIAKVGNFIGAEALYTGTVYIPEASISKGNEEHLVCPKGSKCYTTSVACTTKTVNFKLVPRLVQVSRGQVVYSDSKFAARDSHWCDDGGQEIATNALLGAAAADVFQQVREDVAPYTKKIAVSTRSWSF
jgi:curli biogenesis system outer membrane secretion channel CsgG